MGSLLIVKGGEFFTALPKGVPCPPMDTAARPGTHIVNVVDFAYNQHQRWRHGALGLAG